LTIIATRATARQVVANITRDLMARLQWPTQHALHGAIDRQCINHRPHYHEINWHRTIRKNMHHYLPEQCMLVVEKMNTQDIVMARFR